MAYEIGFVDDAGTEGLAHWQMLKAIKTLAEANGWTTMRYTTPTDGSSRELILRGAGAGGTDQIFIGFRTYHDVTADYYNLSVAGFTGYVPGNTWDLQPGRFESGVPAHNQRIDYFMQASPRRINFAWKVTGPVYMSGGAGFYLPLATPGQLPYPLYVAGMLNGAPPTRYSDTSMSMPWKGSRTNLGLRFLDGTWRNPKTHPWVNSIIAATNTAGQNRQLRDTNSNYPVLKVTLYEDTPNQYGYLDGIGYVSNFNNTVESMVQIGGTPITDNPAWTAQQRATAIETAGGVPWICIQDVARTSFTDYFAMELK
jgi:hypothetical protein